MAKDAATYQILVVDDSPVSRKLVEQALEAADYSLLFAQSGREALELFRRHSPSIVVTDWMMPDFSGLELCERIRAARSASTPTSSCSAPKPKRIMS